MTELDFDENGWAIGELLPFAATEAWSILAPDATARIDAPRWAHQAETFFRARLGVSPEKRYPAGTLPMVDAALVEIAPRGAEGATRVLLVTVPLDRAPDVRSAAAAGVEAMGGAGFDALLRRARRLWQVRALPLEGGDARAPLAIAGVLASLLLGPVVPPGGGPLFGVKGARERLGALGWKT